MTPCAAIPTFYKGVRFRSRLEAKWAAFFNSLTWPWEYEPIDLDGYIPDFILTFERRGRPAPMLVEVKPALYPEDLAKHTEKIDASGWRHEALIVGAYSPTSFHIDGKPFLGFTRSGKYGLEPEWGYTEFIKCCGRTSFATRLDYCALTGCLAGEKRSNDLPELSDQWAQAGNKTQWRRAA